MERNTQGVKKLEEKIEQMRRKERWKKGKKRRGKLEREKRKRGEAYIIGLKCDPIQSQNKTKGTWNDLWL